MLRGQIKTAAQVLGAALLAPIVLAAWYGWIEWRTLSDSIEGNHITKTGRVLAREHPWVLLLTGLWLCFWCLVAAIVAGHVYA